MTATALALAFAGTGLTAFAVFAPGRRDSPAVSFAPPADPVTFEPPPVERWTPPAAPDWPALVDPRAGGSAAPVRLALIEALTTLSTPWADALLERARDDESDPEVRAAAVRAPGYDGRA
ncbi:MAG TPA: hypothetical protein VHT05_06680 [Candidatus Elarobacter sp.]|jgi:hypothetical protein|nr:hypothetical protein [Candidatus Elarobacter sp.]